LSSSVPFIRALAMLSVREVASFAITDGKVGAQIVTPLYYTSHFSDTNTPY